MVGQRRTVPQRQRRVEAVACRLWVAAGERLGAPAVAALEAAGVERVRVDVECIAGGRVPERESRPRDRRSR